MSEHTFHQDEWIYLLEDQVHSQSPERMEILPGLRARFGNLLREEIVSVRLEYSGSSYSIVIMELGALPFHRLIDRYVPKNILELPEPPRLDRLLHVAFEWVSVLDTLDAAREFELFTSHSLALIERISSIIADSVEQVNELQKEQNEKAFYSALALDMAEEFAPAIYNKIKAALRSQYKMSPANGMVGEDCSSEWQEMGAMLFDGSHLLLDMGIQQLEFTVSNVIKKLSRAERLALWCKYSESITDFVHEAEPGESFDLPNDSDSYNGIVEAIAQSLQSDMMDDWEKKRHEMEHNYWRDDENEA